jgi:superfamily II DNA/RNA helicase
VRSRPELVQRRRLGALLAALRARRRARRAAQELERLLAHALPVHAQLEQHFRGNALALADQAQQQVLGADVVVAQRARLLHRQLEHALRPWRERDLADRHGAARGAHHVLDLLADAVEVEAEVVQDGRGDALALADHAEQEVLGADVVVLQPRRLLARQVDDLADPLGEFVVHGIRAAGPVRPGAPPPSG